MEIIIKQVEIIERMDRLIRMRATGAPEDFAFRLDISKTKLYRMINIMKSLKAPIAYDITIQSFVYEEAVGFSFGFYRMEQSALNKSLRPGV
ncbi:DNA-binding protein [Aquimarina sediminis]|uniref:DNA-binding protein n=1 Tax=Aquimarina sediminis TaxID=2070536 RepID=UPI000CA03667|nr:DNA-binding protein [Aquimarina sediminis]